MNDKQKEDFSLHIALSELKAKLDDTKHFIVFVQTEDRSIQFAKDPSTGMAGAIFARSMNLVNKLSLIADEPIDSIEDAFKDIPRV